MSFFRYNKRTVKSFFVTLYGILKWYDVTKQVDKEISDVKRPSDDLQNNKSLGGYYH